MTTITYHDVMNKKHRRLNLEDNLKVQKLQDTAVMLEAPEYFPIIDELNELKRDLGRYVMRDDTYTLQELTDRTIELWKKA